MVKDRWQEMRLDYARKKEAKKSEADIGEI